MREIDPKFELFDIAHVRARDRIVANVEETEIARLGESRGTIGEYKNSGNEAKKSLKTKDRAVPNAAFRSGFCAPATPNQAPKRAETPHIPQNELEAPSQLARPRRK